jgi:RNA polymerase sigma-70 factor (ECF subfamily)
MRSKDVPDAELAALAQAGDREAYGTLVMRYAPQARRVARAILGNPEDADDAAQDGFLAALRHLGRYDPDRPFGPWLVRIVANAAADRRRRRKVRRTEELSPLAATAAPGPVEVTDRRALRAALEAALADLPERQRVAVLLFDVEGYSHAEIAGILEVPEGTVRSDVFHARRALREPLAAWRTWKERDT